MHFGVLTKSRGEKTASRNAWILPSPIFWLIPKAAPETWEAWMQVVSQRRTSKSRREKLRMKNEGTGAFKVVAMSDKVGLGLYETHPNAS